MRCSRHLVLCTVHTILQCADWESYLSCSTHIAICLPQHRCLEKLVHDDTTLWLFRIIADETVLLRRYLRTAEQHYDWRLFPWRAFILGSSRRFAVVSELVGHDALDSQTVKVSDDTSPEYLAVCIVAICWNTHAFSCGHSPGDNGCHVFLRVTHYCCFSVCGLWYLSVL